MPCDAGGPVDTDRTENRRLAAGEGNGRKRSLSPTSSVPDWPGSKEMSELGGARSIWSAATVTH